MKHDIQAQHAGMNVYEYNKPSRDREENYSLSINKWEVSFHNYHEDTVVLQLPINGAEDSAFLAYSIPKLIFNIGSQLCSRMKLFFLYGSGHNSHPKHPTGLIHAAEDRKDCLLVNELTRLDIRKTISDISSCDSSENLPPYNNMKFMMSATTLYDHVINMRNQGLGNIYTPTENTDGLILGRKINLNNQMNAEKL